MMNIQQFFKELPPIYFQTVSGPFTVQKWATFAP